MLSPAHSLRVVNYDSVNQFIYGGSVKLLQVGIPVCKLEKASYISNLPRFIFNFLFQRGSISACSVSYCAESF